MHLLEIPMTEPYPPPRDNAGIFVKPSSEGNQGVMGFPKVVAFETRGGGNVFFVPVTVELELVRVPARSNRIANEVQYKRQRST